jgi:biotin synthase-related radical SAM superfamily protein
MASANTLCAGIAPAAVSTPAARPAPEKRLKKPRRSPELLPKYNADELAKHGSHMP